MKKCLILNFFLCLLALHLQAQSTTVNISGTVTNSSGVGLSNIQITIAVPPNPIFNYSTTVYTDSNGQYSDVITNAFSQGLLTIGMLDCDSTVTNQNHTWFGDSTYIFADFLYCDMTGPSCDVTISADSTAGGVLLTANATGTPPFLYEWSNGSTDPFTFINTAGQHCVTITDATGCLAGFCGEYSVPGGCTANIYTNPASGTLSAFGSGVGPLSYVWSTGDSTFSIQPNFSDTFCVSIIYADGCVAEACTYFEGGTGDPCSLSIYEDSTIVAGTVLAANLNAGQASPSTYQWTYAGITVGTASTFEPMTEGWYCLEVVFDNNCVANECYYFSMPSACYGFVHGVQGTSCINANSVFGQAPISYLWSEGSTDITICPPDEGLYCVTMTDAVGCTATDCFILYEVSDTLCEVHIYEGGQLTGMPTLNAAWDSTIYNPTSFTWYFDGAIVDTNYTMVPTETGEYCVSVNFDNNCAAYECYYYEGSLDTLCNVSIALSPSQVGCITAYVDGVFPYTFNWDNGSTSQVLCPTSSGTYCVTVTDFLGCEATACYYYSSNPIDTLCGVNINLGGSGCLNATAWGTAPYSYQWNNGVTTNFVCPDTADYYCVTVTDADGCITDDCYYYPGNSNCSVILVDSVWGGVHYLVADTYNGQWPYTYSWSTGATSPTIVPDTSGYYCVTVTDATGCEAYDCHYYSDMSNCSVFIIDSLSGAGDELLAIAGGTAPFTYSWSTGETTQYITPSSNGSYCVTITDASGCVASNCFYYSNGIFNTINGTVYTIDSLTAPALTGTAFLIQYDTVGGGTLNLIDTVPLMEDPFGFVNYDFGAVPDGEYLVKVALDENSPGYADNLPTYHYSSLFWNQADVITVPYNNWSWFNVNMIPGNNPGGPGFIGGLVVEGANFAGFVDTRDGEGDPVENVLIILLDENDQAVAYDYTDEEGAYEFPNLAWGTYQVVVEIPGFEQAIYEITIGPNQPSIANVTFAVDEDSVAFLDATNIEELKIAVSFALFPNPVREELTVQFEMKTNSTLEVQLVGIDGKMHLSQRQDLPSGPQELMLDLRDYPNGLYFLNLIYDGEILSRKVVKQ